MRLGVFLALFGNQPLETALDYVQRLGLGTVEVGTGNYLGRPALQAGGAAEEQAEAAGVQGLFRVRAGLKISALSCHGNPIHPDKKMAKQHAQIQRKTIELAAKLGMRR